MFSEDKLCSEYQYSFTNLRIFSKFNLQAYNCTAFKLHIYVVYLKLTDYLFQDRRLKINVCPEGYKYICMAQLGCVHINVQFSDYTFFYILD